MKYSYNELKICGCKTRIETCNKLKSNASNYNFSNIHGHECTGTVEKCCEHCHDFRSMTCQEICIPCGGHKHKITAKTANCAGHCHNICIETGPNIDLGVGCHAHHF